MTSANLDPERQQNERDAGSFTSRPVPTDEWLGDVFFRGYIGASGEPKGIIPQD